MTAKVVEFKRPVKEQVVEEVEQHACGEAFCIQCGHNWVATAPLGVTELECPSCHTMKGLYRFHFLQGVINW